MNIEITETNLELGKLPPEEIIVWAHKTFDNSLILTSSFDGDSAVTLHMVTRVIPSIPVIYIDTGEGSKAVQLEEMREHFDLNLLVCKINKSSNKADTLNRVIKSFGAQAWISGVRSDQTDHRASLDTLTRRPDGLYKIHPILKWTAGEVALYLKMWSLPFTPTQEESIDTKVECGIHTSCGDGDKI